MNAHVRAVPPIFVTGGSGFVGREVLAQLAAIGARDVRVLARDPARLPALPPSWTIVRGALGDGSPAWRATLPDALRGVHTVLHLASSTGKVPAAVHHRQIVEATAELLEAAGQAGVSRVCYVSSIAAAFADRTAYHYADAKREAEARVRHWPGPFLIVRPTMVFGPGSPVQQGLAQLATLPVPVLFGDGRARVAPVHVRELAALLVEMLDASLEYGQRTVAVGGPEDVTLDALVRRLRTAAGLGARGTLHVPVAPLRPLLAALEPLLLPLMPVTAGQLASFVNDSAAPVDGDDAAWLASLRARAHDRVGAPWDLDRMLQP